MRTKNGEIKKYKEILVLPDAHCQPEQNNERMEWVMQLALERQPDYIVDIGDSADMASLSQYDVGTVIAEGRRYADDIAAYHDAAHRMKRVLDRYNSTQARFKKRRYSPVMIKTRGNHENRIVRAAAQDPKYYGHISVNDLREAEFGWDAYDYLTPVEIEGICFSHAFTSGVMGRPIGGENHAATLVKKGYMSCVCGHSHMRDFWETTDAMGRKRFGLVVGCYFEHDEHYTTENDRFWRGLVYLHDVRNGMAEPEFLHIDYLRRKYG